jgi:dipeptidyl aminopeptidase/acylaminoacyl peptidase
MWRMTGSNRAGHRTAIASRSGLSAVPADNDLYTIDPYAADPKRTIVQLTNDPALDWNPVWSPDGKYLYFGSDRDGTLNLWRMPIEHQGTALGPPEPISLPTRYAAHLSIARNSVSRTPESI